MLNTLRILGPLALICVPLLFATPVIAEYEIPSRVLGYRMILASKVHVENDQPYIRFTQFDNLTPPFVLIETKTYDLKMTKIQSEVVDGRLEGRILLPLNMSGDDVQEMRVNGYSILWKNID